tara:strand:- start:508 stop:963 length:456 start_codon:yes stop_codon:yes gene_type:complete
MAMAKNKNDELHFVASRRLQASGMRYSKSRRAIVEILVKAKRPLTLVEILELSDKRHLPQSSAYRNTVELSKAGVVRRLATGNDHNRFELDESLIGHHHHLVCIVCGEIEDFEVSEDLENSISQLEEKLGNKGFSVEGHTFDIQGRCSGCS